MMIAKEIGFCAQVLKTVHANQPNIRNVFHREIREQIQRERCLVAPNGRRRDFYGSFQGARGEKIINEGISQLPQAIVTDYMKTALPQVRCAMGDKMRPLSEAHDGFLSEVKNGFEEEYAHCFKTKAEVGIDFRTCSLPRDFELVIPLEAESSSTHWGEMRKLQL